jgi:hypothetical protein
VSDGGRLSSLWIADLEGVFCERISYNGAYNGARHVDEGC